MEINFANKISEIKKEAQEIWGDFPEHEVEDLMFEYLISNWEYHLNEIIRSSDPVQYMKDHV